MFYNDYKGLYAKEVYSLLTVAKNIAADVSIRATSKAVVAKQYDVSSRILNVRIQESGRDMNIDNTCTAILNVQRPDASTGMIMGSINENGTVKVVLSAWVLEQAGTVSCDISVIKEDATKLTTMTFYIDVEPAVCSDGDIIETEEYSILLDLIADTQEACNTATEAANTATRVVQMCSAATQTALDAAQTALDAAGRIDSLIGTACLIIQATVE